MRSRLGLPCNGQLDLREPHVHLFLSLLAPLLDCALQEFSKLLQCCDVVDCILNQVPTTSAPSQRDTVIYIYPLQFSFFPPRDASEGSCIH